MTLADDATGRVFDFAVNATHWEDTGTSQVLTPARPWPPLNALPPAGTRVTLTSAQLGTEDGEPVSLPCVCKVAGWGATAKASGDKVTLSLIGDYDVDEEYARIESEYACVQGSAQALPHRVRFRQDALGIFDTDAKVAIRALAAAKKAAKAREQLASLKRKRDAYAYVMEQLGHDAKRARSEADDQAALALMRENCEDMADAIQSAEAKVATLVADK